MKSKDMAAYVPMVQNMADIAIAFLAEQGLCFPVDYPLPELRLSLERRVKVHGIYNKGNVLAELKRLQSGFNKEIAIAETKEPLLMAVDFLDKLELFLSGCNTEASGLKAWLRLEQEFALLEDSFPGKPDSVGIASRLKLWQQLVRLYAKLRQLEIKQQLSGVFSSEGRITIYMNNIEAICRELGIDIKGYLQSVLVHEYVHACHYACFMEQQLRLHKEQFALERAELRWSGAYYSRARTAAVKESLARYIQILWCKMNEPCLVSCLLAREYGEFVIAPNWPYAGAGVLLTLSEEAAMLFDRIWNNSLTDWEQAYRLLIPRPDMVK